MSKFLLLLCFTSAVFANNLAHNIESNSGNFLNKPYKLFPLGEGKTGRYDQKPRIRFDAFDCMTYVETVLAMSILKKDQSVIAILDKIRYHQNPIDYKVRNHFTELDWNTNNERQGFIKDITTKILDQNKQPFYITISSTIDKGSWFQNLKLENIQLFHATDNLKNQRLQELHEYGKTLKPKTIQLTYLPINKIIAEPNILQQIPNAAIIEIVRPNWDLTKIIGTKLNISHLGFAIWQNGILYFRNASSIHHIVTQEPLLNYLKNIQNSPTIKGIKILQINNFRN